MQSQDDKKKKKIIPFAELHGTNSKVQSISDYKYFNIAYFQQIIIKEKVDDRTALLFSKRFLEKEEEVDDFLESNIG